MKSIIFLFFQVFLVVISHFGSTAQESQQKWKVGSDFYNRYIWRGTDYGNSPVVQPTIKYTDGGFSTGLWGSYSLSSNTGATEADLFISYVFKNGFGLQVTDYYFPFEPGSVGRYFDYQHAHIFEATALQSIGKFNLSGNWYFACANNDIYLEAGYTFKAVSILAGAGNKSFSSTGEFNVVNLGISSTRIIPVTEKFSLPLTGKVILNPDKEQIFLVVGFSL